MAALGLHINIPGSILVNYSGSNVYNSCVMQYIMLYNNYFAIKAIYVTMCKQKIQPVLGDKLQHTSCEF